MGGAVTAEQVVQWRRWMQAAGMARTTIELRTGVVQRAGRVLGRPVERAGRQEVTRWLAGHASPATRRTYGLSLRAYGRWLAETTGQADPLAWVPVARVPRALPRPLTPDQVGQVLAACRTARERVWVLLQAYSGLRACEVAATGPHQLAGDRLWLPRQKGQGGGWAVIAPDVAAELAACDPWEASADAVQRAVSVVIRRAGVAGTPHQLRHHCGTQTLRATGNLRLAQEVLRHSSPASTAIYTEVDGSELTAAVTAIPRPWSAAA